MKHSQMHSAVVLALTFLMAWLIFRCFVPFFLPFLLGWGLAALVQPQIRFLEHRLHLPRGVSSALAVSGGLVLLGMSVVLLAAVGCREAGILAKGLPAALETLSLRAEQVEQWALARAERAPRGLAEPLEQMVRRLFSSGSALLERGTAALLPVAGSLVGSIPGGAVTAGTAVLSAYLTAARYPALSRQMTESRLWQQTLQPILRRLGGALGSWLRAQIRLSGVTFGIVLAGMLLLRVERSLLWAMLTALVDAVPLLGTGTTLIPMAAVSLIWGDRIRGIGLLGIYVTALVTRSSLEPRLVGRQLGLSPLATLAALYAGFRLWGVLGMIFAPVLAVLACQLAEGPEET